MFTGLIQHVGAIGGVVPSHGGWRVTVRVGGDAWPRDPVVHGESVAVEGACLTVAEPADGSFGCDVLDETLRRTTLGGLSAGEPVNLERAMRPADRFGGHIVQGHVDGVGTVRDVRRAGRDYVLSIACDDALLADMVEKGSVALNGVSLTIASLASDAFEVHIIPVTWAETSLSALHAGRAVNIETDVLAKHVRRVMETSGVAHRSGGLTEDDLRQAGFI